MQNANPEHLDQLADLLAGKRGGSLSNGLDEAFRRASALGVSERLAPLKPMRTWTSDTAPDLRRRATVLRLENGDPQAGLKWAGFTPEELQAQPGLAQHPIVLLLSNAVASSKWVAESYYFHRKPNESLDDWVKRLEGKSVAKVVGGDPKNWTTLLADVSDARSIRDAGSVVFVQGGALTLTLGGNYLKKAFDESVRVTRIRNALGAKATQWLAHSNIFVRGLGWGTQKVVDFRFPIRSLSAPGAWLPGKVAGLLSGSQRYQQLAGIPGTGGFLGDRWAWGWDWFRRQAFMNWAPRSAMLRGITPNRMIDFFVGSDEAAKVFGGRTHSGQLVQRAGQVDLRRVSRGVTALQREAGMARPRLGGIAAAAKTAGAFRSLNIGTSAASTVYDVTNVASQGWPWNAFKKNKVGYSADVAQTLFDGSMTAALVAPNPFTIGAAVVTGAVYGGLKVAQHWPEIKSGAKKLGHAAVNAGKSLAGGAKKVAKKLNPFNW